VDDAFFGYICSAKDTLGQMTSIITSSVGAGIVTGYSNRKREAIAIADGTAVFTGNDEYTASVTILLNGINSFLYQLVLFPLYSMIALQKSVVCTTNDVFALFDAVGFRIRLGRPDFQAASDVAAGVCMTSFFAENLDSYQETESAEELTTGLSQFMQNAAQMKSAFKAGSSRTISGTRTANTLNLLLKSNMDVNTRVDLSNAGSKKKPLFDRLKNNNIVKRLGNVVGKAKLTAPYHALDSFLTYLMGVVSGMEDMAQVIDSEHCKLPDYYIHKAPTCACGDDAVRIPDSRRREGLSEHAHWCSGTLQLQDGFGNSVHVFNPYTYDQLRAMAVPGSIDRYFPFLLFPFFCCCTVFFLLADATLADAFI